jgi:hypothetical protein
MEDAYPYQTFYKKKPYILKRDNYTCQVCGYYGFKEKDIVVTRCIECEKKEYPFNQIQTLKSQNLVLKKG